jgi:heptosyltransferase-1
MGDLMHALPALTDAVAQNPGVTFDWVVDESFAEVPSWHPAVRHVFKSAHRRWRKQFGASFRKKEFSNFYRQLNHANYDLVIDAQNNIKSSFISFLRKGPVHGMDKTSVAERPAHWAYKYRYKINTSLHAITRQRALFAAAMGYTLPETAPQYGLLEDAFAAPDIAITEPYIVLVHNASWSTKLWPESHWHALIDKAEAAGYQVVLPGGSQAELLRGKKLASEHENAMALPRLSLSALGGLIQRAAGAINCDTGLAHLTAMIGTPAVTLYGPTSAQLIGTTGRHQQQLIASDPPFTCAPCYKRYCDYAGEKKMLSSCMAALEVENGWDLLLAEIRKSQGSQAPRL